MTTKLIIAGFGGQGILFFGKLLSYKALFENKEVSWLPSYGPEMRGETATCSVTISSSLIGSPIIDEPDILVAMNLPSLDKFESKVKSGGKIFVDSTMVERKIKRSDVEAFYIPSSALSQEMGNVALSNIVLLGKVLKECPELGRNKIEEAIKKVVSARHQDMYEINLEAINRGFNC